MMDYWGRAQLAWGNYSKWVYYGYVSWPSYSYWIVPGTITNEEPAS